MRTALTGLSAIAAVACAAAPTRGQVAPTMCGSAAPETRWLSESYRETSAYGAGGDGQEHIGSYGGLAASGDDVFLYDQMRRRIVHLSADLEELRAFGRVGEGPGEFQGPVPVTWLNDFFEGHVAFDGRRLTVYDRRRLSAFDAEGQLHWSVRMPHTGGVFDGVRFVGAVDDEEMIFGMDAVARVQASGGGLDAENRRLQLWSVRRPEASRPQLVWERPMVAGVGDSGRWRREARSYWSRHNDCVVVSDGGSGFLWLVDPARQQADSVALPAWEVPEFGELSSDRSAGNPFGGRAQSAGGEPALLARWTGLIVDPDGHAWVRAWTESTEEFEVFVVSLASGESRRLSDPPAFPTAFGPPGVFYSARVKPETGEHHLVRFEAAGR